MAPTTREIAVCYTALSEPVVKDLWLKGGVIFFARMRQNRSYLFMDKNPSMNRTMQLILEWGMIHGALAQAAEICYQLWGTQQFAGASGMGLRVKPFYPNEHIRGGIVLWAEGKEPDRLEKEALPPGSITYNWDNGERNGINYFSTGCYIWSSGKWTEGPVSSLFMTKGGVFKTCEILSNEEGLRRWNVGRTIPCGNF